MTDKNEQASPQELNDTFAGQLSLTDLEQQIKEAQL